MIIQFVAIDIHLNPSDDLERAVKTQLQRRGTPLRWAITAVDRTTGTAHVEAVLTTEVGAAP